MENFFITQWFDWTIAKPSRRVEIANMILEKLEFWVRLQPPPPNGMTNVEQRMNLYHLVSQVLFYGVPGDLVELGCNEGQSSVLIQRIIEHFDPTRKFHVYDSFEGLPERSSADGQVSSDFREGRMRTSKEVLISNFHYHGLRLPVIHQGWFEDTLPATLPEQISFAYLDGDLYSSILVSLQHVYPRMSPGAICLIDDYADPEVNPDGWNELPGVKRACDEYLADKPEKISCIYSAQMSHGFFRKLRADHSNCSH
jgi:O-methyltransferase